MSWYLEMNQFADLTPEEFSVRRGHRADRSKQRSHYGARMRPGHRVEVPDSKDWNADGAVTHYIQNILSTLSINSIYKESPRGAAYGLSRCNFF